MSSTHPRTNDAQIEIHMDSTHPHPHTGTADCDGDNKSKEPKARDVWLFSYDMSQHSSTVRLLTGLTGIFVTNCFSGFYQEYLVFARQIKYSTFLTLIMVLAMAVFSGFERIFTKWRLGPLTGGRSRTPRSRYFLLCCLHMGSLLTANSSLNFINYPVQIVFKSSKVIPTMLLGLLVMHKSYPGKDYIAALLLSTGLTIFTLADKSVSPNFDVIGVFLILSSVLFDSLLSNFQGRTNDEYGPTASEVSLYMYTFAVFPALLFCVCSSELTPGVELVLQDLSIIPPLIIWGFFNYLSIQFILFFITWFGPVNCTIVTSSRKSLTVFISFAVFGHTFLVWHLIGGILFCCGIALPHVVKERPPKAVSL